MTEEYEGKTYTLDMKKINQPREIRPPAAWAREGNDDPIPLKKMPYLPASQITSGEMNSMRIPNGLYKNMDRIESEIKNFRSNAIAQSRHIKLIGSELNNFKSRVIEQDKVIKSLLERLKKLEKRK